MLIVHLCQKLNKSLGILKTKAFFSELKGEKRQSRVDYNAMVSATSRSRCRVLWDMEEERAPRIAWERLEQWLSRRDLKEEDGQGWGREIPRPWVESVAYLGSL